MEQHPSKAHSTEPDRQVGQLSPCKWTNRSDLYLHRLQAARHIRTCVVGVQWLNDSLLISIHLRLPNYIQNFLLIHRRIYDRPWNDRWSSHYEVLQNRKLTNYATVCCELGRRKTCHSVSAFDCKVYYPPGDVSLTAFTSPFI